ncbi:MAG: D-alanyl-D-alanine carboxypeptidase [Rickettsiales bacterium]|jgi:D-alanyl-D-alanine carboxypeptidase (penicillin-binding protein 5/6)|nr:D-alanyl-D-alanine carboxypeptidase [Rickettsiales bacterium]
MKRIPVLLTVYCCLSTVSARGAAPAVVAPAWAGPAKSYYLVDFQSGQAIVSKSADDLMIPASMIKLMTAELAFDALRSGKISMNTKLITPKNADHKNPALLSASKVCLSEGQVITVEDALTGLLVVSGGDAAITLAEKLGGSEEAFVQMMTERARKIGMEYTSFGNSSGLPDVNNLSTSRELAILADHIIRTYPEYLYFFRTRRFEFVNPITDFCRAWAKSHAINYNKLLFIMGGADGMKTGHTVKGGYGMVATANRKNRRLIAVINGMNAKGHDPLALEAKRLLEYGYENTFNREIKSEAVVPVWYGRKPEVIARTKRPFILTLKNGTDLDALRVSAFVSNDISAPLAAGEEVGLIVATLDGVEIKSDKLYAVEDVPRIRFFGRILRNIRFFAEKL